MVLTGGAHAGFHFDKRKAPPDLSSICPKPHLLACLPFSGHPPCSVRTPASWCILSMATPSQLGVGPMGVHLPLTLIALRPALCDSSEPYFRGSFSRCSVTTHGAAATDEQPLWPRHEHISCKRTSRALLFHINPSPEVPWSAAGGVRHSWSAGSSDAEPLLVVPFGCLPSARIWPVLTGVPESCPPLGQAALQSWTWATGPRWSCLAYARNVKTGQTHEMKEKTWPLSNTS